ncbi:BREX system ATP-binding domain-containing protein [Actinoplanes missouriensis]|uniref:BREX system ATP-binding domain-containing protein n=1 Tax=Actinoplanes missouriensis TaxID=1866 RepID=UPI0033F99972
MNDFHQPAAARDRRAFNPFPAAAVAGPVSSVSAETPLTIETEAIKSARRHVLAYLTSAREDVRTSGQGTVYTVVGEYGTGKTHLALHMLNQISTTEDLDVVRLMYLDAPGGDVFTLYRDRFIPKLASLDVNERVLEYYSDVVAEALSSSDLTAPLASRLAARDITADNVVQDLGLMESDLRRRLCERLRRITQREDFATALTLYPRPEFRNAVWEWFRGADPDAALIERGIKSKIQSEEDALAAIGVFALLYGHQGKRLVVVFDEMEKILFTSGLDGRTARVTQALKRLFEVAHETNSLFILCGLPDFMEALPSDVRQRIDDVLWPGRLDTGNVTEYIQAVMTNAFGVSEIAPFTKSGIGYLTELAGGNARAVVRLCYLSYARAVGERVEVDPPLIREVAREQYEAEHPVDVARDIENVLTRSGWRYERDVALKVPRARGRAGERVDFWLPIGDTGGGCAIVISPSVLQDGDVASLTKTFSRISTSQARRSFLLVVNGYLSEAKRPDLEAMYDRVLTRGTVHFTSALTDAVHALVTQVDVHIREAAMTRVSDQLDRLVRQNIALQSSMDRMARQSSANEAMSDAAELGLRRVFGRLAGAQSTEFPPDFSKTRTVFDGILRRLDAVVEPVDLILSSNPPTKRPTRRISAQLLTSPDLFTGASCALLLRSITLSFRRGVVSQLNTVGRADSQDFASDIADLCGAMNTTMNSPGIRQLSTALDKWTRIVGSHAEERPLIDILRRLGADVHHAITRDLEDSTLG